MCVRERVLSRTHILSVCESAPTLTNTWVWVCRCRLNTLTDACTTEVLVHMREDVRKLMNLQTRVHRAAGLIRNTGMEPE